jgi:predicted transcriptional regulator
MHENQTMDPDLMARVDALASRTGMTREEIVRDALENGRSLAWQEEFLRRIEAGKSAADRGEFASPEDIERVLNKYRPS